MTTTRRKTNEEPTAETMSGYELIKKGLEQIDFDQVFAELMPLRDMVERLGALAELEELKLKQAEIMQRLSKLDLGKPQPNVPYVPGYPSYPNYSNNRVEPYSIRSSDNMGNNPANLTEIRGQMADVVQHDRVYQSHEYSGRPQVDGDSVSDTPLIV